MAVSRPVIVLPSIDQNQGDAVAVPLVTTSQTQQPSLALRLKLRNGTNQLLLYRLREHENEGKRLFRVRPSSEGILSPDDVQPLELIAESGIDWNSIAGFVLSIQTAYVEAIDDDESQSIIDVNAAWMRISAENVTSSKIPIRFVVTNTASSPVPEPVQLPIDIVSESDIDYSIIGFSNRFSNMRRQRPEEFWAIKMLALAVIIVSFSIGFAIGTKSTNSRK